MNAAFLTIPASWVITAAGIYAAWGIVTLAAKTMASVAVGAFRTFTPGIVVRAVTEAVIVAFKTVCASWILIAADNDAAWGFITLAAKTMASAAVVAFPFAAFYIVRAVTEAVLIAFLTIPAGWVLIAAAFGAAWVIITLAAKTMASATVDAFRTFTPGIVVRAVTEAVLVTFKTIVACRRVVADIYYAANAAIRASKAIGTLFNAVAIAF